MCRLLVYKGPKILMSELVVRPERSLIRQSYQARERREPLNGDGFGVGWYDPEFDPIPGVLTSTTPAWSNRNLQRLSEKVRSPLFFAHVRAASHGALVSEVNCHPFQYRELLWMHNGHVAGFPQIRRRLRESLSDEAYDLIQGTTDSEHAFALFVDRLRSRWDDYTPQTLRRALVETIAELVRLTGEAGIERPSYYNFAVCDGHSVVASRYTDRPGVTPASLYVSRGEAFALHEGTYRMLPAAGAPRALIIASEPLTEHREDWQAVPPGHTLTITPELHERLQPIEIHGTRPAQPA